MRNLISEMDDLWEIVTDLLTFYHTCCTTCQPYEGGEVVWLSSSAEDMTDVMRELIVDVAAANNQPIDETFDTGDLARAIEASDITCPNCGTQWYADTTIGSAWLVSDGQTTATATHLLSKVYWPYLTHYTKATDAAPVADVLAAILRERIIRANTRFITGGHHVVALTECSPLEIHAFLTYTEQPNADEMLRWTRSPVGIAFRRGAIIQAGALPAIHDQRRLYDYFPADQRFRFVTFDRDVPGGQRDWTFEREFRFPGDVHVDQFHPDDVLVVVPDRRTQFHMLAQRDVVPCAIVPFDYLFDEDVPYPRRTHRQQQLSW